MNAIDMIKDSEELKLIAVSRIDKDGSVTYLNVMKYIDLSPISRGSIIEAVFEFPRTE